MSNKLLLGGAIVVALVLLAMSAFWYRSQPGKLDTFAQCLGEKGATFYGAFWCPHCQNQKALFGNSAKLLPYIECSTSDGKQQLQICTDAGITGYPTWEFANGERLSGEVELKVLSEKTGCELP
ncbi:MAG TPA: thioredoxin domain-containing protein [Candidatus Paceibacterota bacterium]